VKKYNLVYFCPKGETNTFQYYTESYTPTNALVRGLEL